MVAAGAQARYPSKPVRDFAPVGQVGITPTVLAVHPSVPAKGVQGLVVLMKASPGKFSYRTSGLGLILHLCDEQFKTSSGRLDAGRHTGKIGRVHQTRVGQVCADHQGVRRAARLSAGALPGAEIGSQRLNLDAAARTRSARFWNSSPIRASKDSGLSTMGRGTITLPLRPARGPFDGFDVAALTFNC